jgi:hypothetical protein
MQFSHAIRPVFAFGFAFAGLAGAGAMGCLSSSSGGPNLEKGFDAADDAPITPVGDAGGSVGVEAGVDAAVEAGPVEAGASAGDPHQGFGIVAGGVWASSSAHVLVTATGQAPGGNATMHSASHKLVGGVVGGTQQP